MTGRHAATQDSVYSGCLPYNPYSEARHALRCVGVLGGMGPQATVLLQQRVISAVRALDDADHVPLLVHMNPQIPSRIDWMLKGRGINPGPVLARMARELAQSGAQALAMPCNTAHHFADEISAAVEIPLLNMIEAAAASAFKLAGHNARVGVLASPATCETKLFEKTFQQHTMQAVFPQRQDLMLQAIQTIKSSGDSPAAREALSRAAADCQTQGATCLMVGCSEFSIIADAIVGELPVVDTVDVLVDEIVKFSGATTQS